MINQKNIIKFLFAFVIISLISINKVSALENYENLGNLNSNTTFYVIYPGATSPTQMPINQEWNFADYNINSFLINIDNYNFKKNNTYRLTLTLPKSIITNANSYSVVTSNGNTCSTGLIIDMHTNYPKFSFNCGVDTNSISFKIFNSNGGDIITNHWWFSWTNIGLERLLTSDENLDNTIKDTFETCVISPNLFNPKTDIELTNSFRDFSNGTIINTNDYSGLKIPVKPNTTYVTSSNISSINYSNLTFFTKNMQYISGTAFNTNDKVFTTPANTYFITIAIPSNFEWFQLEEGSSVTPYKPYGEECKNKIDETNDQLGDLNNNITNDNINNNKVTDAFNEFENFVDENATISTLITLPVTLFTAILNGMQNSCASFNLGNLYGEPLVLPCIDISSYLGDTLWTMIDIIISGFAIYFISQKFIKVFNNFSSMKEGDVIDD